ncbi:DUF3710 domain-containing protein [Kitasatospora sp. NPDC087271]|uniref:DUF3710 domain-containing protein n=1 Tax=Kitasatospora sp. NPDC087271 TaxID=3364067 RepID=UPI0037FF6C53
MGDVGSAARQVLDEFQRDGSLSPETASRARWEDRPESLTPALVLMFAVKTLLRLRAEEREPFPADVQAIASHGLAPNEVEMMVAGLTGDLRAVRDGRRDALFTLQNTLVLLAVLTDDEDIRGADLDFLLGAAEEMADEFLQAENPFRPARRGVDVGPWDVNEDGWQEDDLIDLGGLRIPREPGCKIELKQDKSSPDLLEAGVRRKPTSVQLQAYWSAQGDAWGRARETFAENVRGLGGEAREWAGRAGVELRCDVPVVLPSGDRGVQTVLVLGFEGPGWLLRAVVTGEGADPGGQDDWAYGYVERVVVDPSFRKVPNPLLSPAGFGSLKPPSDSPILLRMPK